MRQKKRINGTSYWTRLEQVRITTTMTTLLQALLTPISGKQLKKINRMTRRVMPLQLSSSSSPGSTNGSGNSAKGSPYRNSLSAALARALESRRGRIKDDHEEEDDDLESWID